jgi:hypothetical protein
MPAEPKYDKEVINENGYTIELSNQGNKPKFNPNQRNLEKKEVFCMVCHKKTRNMFTLCAEHNKEKKKFHIHDADWFARLIPPGYKRDDVLVDVLPHSQITEILIRWMKKDADRERIMDGFVKDVLTSIVGNIPDATMLQKNIYEKMNNMMGPDDLIGLVQGLIDKHFPKDDYGSILLDGGRFKGKSLANIPIRVVAGLLILAWACEECNRGDAFFCKTNNRESKYGNAYMPSVYYFLRRYTNATEKQTRICLK